jgi:acetyl esterase/lipase
VSTSSRSSTGDEPTVATEATAVNRALARHVPPGVVDSAIGERYDAADPDAYVDVHYPAEAGRAGRALPTVVWVHGGGWVSGTRTQVGNYARVLAARGFTVVSVDYSISPHATYPTRVRQVNAALGYLVRHAARLHIHSTYGQGQRRSNDTPDERNSLPGPRWYGAAGGRPKSFDLHHQ